MCPATRKRIGNRSERNTFLKQRSRDSLFHHGRSTSSKSTPQNPHSRSNCRHRCRRGGSSPHLSSMHLRLHQETPERSTAKRTSKSLGWTIRSREHHRSKSRSLCIPRIATHERNVQNISSKFPVSRKRKHTNDARAQSSKLQLPQKKRRTTKPSSKLGRDTDTKWSTA
jgi:hypothetical protein